MSNAKSIRTNKSFCSRQYSALNKLLSMSISMPILMRYIYKRIYMRYIYEFARTLKSLRVEEFPSCAKSALKRVFCNFIISLERKPHGTSLEACRPKIYLVLPLSTVFSAYKVYSYTYGCFVIENCMWREKHKFWSCATKKNL